MKVFPASPSSIDLTGPAYSSTLGSYYIQGYLAGADRHGLDLAGIAKKADIELDIGDPTATINGEQLQRLILVVRENLNDHYMGMLQVPGKLGMDIRAGFATMEGEYLGEGLRYLVDFINAVRSDEERSLEVDERGEASLIYRFAGIAEGADSHLLYWYRMYWGYRFYCWLVGERIQLEKVCFSSRRPQAAINYEQVFGCPVFFDLPRDQLCFHKRWLTLPIIRDKVELANGDFPQRYQDWFAIPGDDQTFAARVEKILTGFSRDGKHNVTMSDVADALSISSRTLSRRLAEEKESFQRIKSRVRFKLAAGLLCNSDIPLRAIAEKVGFSEPGDFTRAFIRWAGQTPSSYRQEHRAQRT